MSYTLDTPHPLYGKDPNILNEMGHTDYPKWVDHPTETKPHPVRKADMQVNGKTVSGTVPVRVLVQNKEEEEELLSKKSKSQAKAEGWDKK